MKSRFFITFMFYLLAGHIAYAENWPGFRGPRHQGLSSEKNLPTQWSSNQNVVWKTAIPGKGWSSPITWNGQIFLTTATEGGESCRIISLDQKTGRILWNREVHRQQIRKKRERNTYATPTPATDGSAVYSVFSDGKIIAVDFDGKILWTNHDIDYYSEHGLGGSPLLYKDLLIMTFDGSSVAETKVGWKIPWEEAVILALDKTSGKVRWRGRRGLSRIAHTTSNILTINGKDQLVSVAGDVIQGFNPQDGSRIWSVYAQGEGVVPSAVVGDQLVFAASGFEKSTIRAVRPDGRGDVTGSHIVWEQTAGVPRIPSFLYVKPFLFTVNETGIAMCLEEATGKIVWRHRVGGNHSASPIWADGLIYFLSDEGETAIIRSAPEYLEVGRNSIGEHCQASIAVSNGQLLIRSEHHLFCIGKVAD